MCKFCDDYRTLKKTEKKALDRVNADPSSEVQLRSYYRLALKAITKRRKKGTKRWYFGGQSVSGNYPLRYCPEWGRKL